MCMLDFLNRASQINFSLLLTIHHVQELRATSQSPLCKKIKPTYYGTNVSNYVELFLTVGVFSRCLPTKTMVYVRDNPGVGTAKISFVFSFCRMRYKIV